MIIMINGAFGSGKTSAASMLQLLVPDSMIFDPEMVGYLLRAMVPEDVRFERERTDDFQDIELWRELTVKLAHEVKNKYNKHLIVPMTIYKLHNFEYIMSGLKELDSELHHFCLIASKDTIEQRLTKRGDMQGGWSFQQTVKCVEAFRDNRFKTYIDTETRQPEDVVDLILSSIGGRR